MGLLQLQVWTEVSGADCTRTYVSQECGCVVGTHAGPCRVLCSAPGPEEPRCGLGSGPDATKNRGRTDPALPTKSSLDLGSPSADPNPATSDLGLEVLVALIFP